MRRTDRLLGILLYLDDHRAVSASQLARRFEVSTRTVYRDIDALTELGVPIYAEPGRSGGYRLVEGYFLPPVMFSEREAISIILGQALLRSIQSHPFLDDLETADRKLLGALPPYLQEKLRDTRRIIGFENVAPDAFHMERVGRSLQKDERYDQVREQRAIDRFLEAVLGEHDISMRYRSPYRSGGPRDYEATPLGMFWDRGCWYLVGRLRSGEQEARTWRADRVLDLRAVPGSGGHSNTFDIGEHLNRAWLRRAMDDWRASHPVRLLITLEQAARLKEDWYYQSARYEPHGYGRVVMSFGQDRPEIVFELVRWLGPGAELLEPAEWRQQFLEDLRSMASAYEPAASELAPASLESQTGNAE